MITAWRIVKHRHLKTAFSGNGARLYGGRWNSPGVSVVYAAESRALATLELVAGLGSIGGTHPYVLIPITFSSRLVKGLDTARLPDHWRKSPPHHEIQALGDKWVQQGRSAILKVPSVLIPEEFNFILNPQHPNFLDIKIGKASTLQLDPRLVP